MLPQFRYSLGLVTINPQILVALHIARIFLAHTSLLKVLAISGELHSFYGEWSSPSYSFGPATLIQDLPPQLGEEGGAGGIRLFIASAPKWHATFARISTPWTFHPAKSCDAHSCMCLERKVNWLVVTCSNAYNTGWAWHGLFTYYRD